MPCHSCSSVSSPTTANVAAWSMSCTSEPVNVAPTTIRRCLSITSCEVPWGIGLVVHVQRLTGSFAAAGVVTGVYGIALGVGGPLLGQLVDRRGQTLVLLASASAAAALLAAIAVLSTGAPLALLVALAAGIGVPLLRSAPGCVANSQACYPIPALSARPTRSKRRSSS